MTHPLSIFRFCPVCGAPEFHIHDARSKRCARCGFTYYLNASAATVAVIRDAEGRLLAVRRAKDPARGTLDLPGGFVDPGEGIAEGCLREVREEVGLEGRIARFLFSLPNDYLFSGFHVPTADSFFEVTVEHPETACAADDAGEILWLAPHEIRPEDFGLDSIRKGISLLLSDYLAENH